MKYTKIEEFFKMLNSFFDDVDKAMPKEEMKKVFNRKHEVGTKIDSNMNNLISELKSTGAQIKKKK